MSNINTQFKLQYKTKMKWCNQMNMWCGEMDEEDINNCECNSTCDDCDDCEEIHPRYFNHSLPLMNCLYN